MTVSTASERFVQYGWNIVRRSLDTPCWEWRGSRAVRGGYGQLNDRGKLLKTHRLSYEMYVGPIPDGAWVLHKCDNPPCVNPKHLFVGDVRDNVADAVAKGRNVVPDGPKGEAHHSAKLTEAEVDTIKGSNEGATTLARQYNVSRQMIWRIRKGKAWKQ